ncbi:WD40/YVTN/BNR-like repeat-containing protein [Hufsiella ginkgonis]|uniref:Oxidoreductase n=1 Tax=Hufsiella ginkgonis TaxID=2695274 RepID=A0A7K1XYM3_9SPHI|nr:hypothetical protein [Hufsiella ginkgonis]MXV16104.1 hypothetical protein [Hufsiella ginkgonis]
MFIDDKKGYIPCLGDKLLKTTDGGASWQVAAPGFGSGYYAAGSGASPYVSGQDKVIRSVDDASSWTMSIDAPRDTFSMHFWDAKAGIALGRSDYTGGDIGYARSSIYVTGDGGEHWEGSSAIESTTGVILGSSFPGLTGYAVNPASVIRVKRIR